MSTESGLNEIALAVSGSFVSENVSDSNLESANVVDVIDKLAWNVGRVASAIVPPNTMSGTDEAGGRIESLTEAVMGITSGLFAIAEAIQSLSNEIHKLDGGE